jgi:hypothetical protein
MTDYEKIVKRQVDMLAKFGTSSFDTDEYLHLSALIKVEETKNPGLVLRKRDPELNRILTSDITGLLAMAGLLNGVWVWFVGEMIQANISSERHTPNVDLMYASAIIGLIASPLLYRWILVSYFEYKTHTRGYKIFENCTLAFIYIGFLPAIGFFIVALFNMLARLFSGRK